MIPSTDDQVQHDVLFFIEELMIDNDRTLNHYMIMKALQAGLEAKILILLTKTDTILRIYQIDSVEQVNLTKKHVSHKYINSPQIQLL